MRIEDQAIFPDREIHIPSYEGEATMIECPHCKMEFDTREANSISHEHKGNRVIVYFCEYCNKLVNGGIFEIKKGEE